jgi:BioD-like phosphotransacetylase family protein
MTTAILVVPTEQRVGLTTVALGLVHALDREGIPGRFLQADQPTARQRYRPERSTRLARTVTSLNPPEPIPVSRRRKACWVTIRENVLLEEVIARYEQAAQNASVVIVEGLMDTEEQPYGTHLNAKMAQSLDAKIIIVAAPWPRYPRQVADTVEVVARPTAASATNGCSAASQPAGRAGGPHRSYPLRFQSRRERLPIPATRPSSAPSAPGTGRKPSSCWAAFPGSAN